MKSLEADNNSAQVFVIKLVTAYLHVSGSLLCDSLMGTSPGLNTSRASMFLGGLL